MAYSEAEVLAGGLAHIPVIVVILLFISSYTKNRSSKTISKSGRDTSSDQIREALEAAEKEKLSLEKKQKELREAEEARLKSLSENEGLQRKQGNSQENIATAAEPEEVLSKVEDQPNNYSKPSLKEGNESDETNSSDSLLEVSEAGKVEELLKAQVEQLEAQAEFNKIQSKARINSNFGTLLSRPQKSKNLLQLIAFATIIIGGSGLFFTQQSYVEEINYPAVNAIKSSKALSQ